VNRYLKLVHMEIYRFRYILGGLMALTAVFQISALVSTLLRELSRRELLGENASGSPLSFAWAVASTNFWFIIPMLICIAVIAMYVFWIWYRDWVGRSSFIYRLLMLPTSRRHIYLAKGTAILLFILSLLSFQMVLLLVENMIFNLIVPAELRVESFFAEIIQSNLALKVLVPQSFEQFFYAYGLGMLAVFVIFTAIMLERCYRGIGILYGILYVGACVLVVTSPVLFLGLDESIYYFYPGEILAIASALCGIVLVISLLLGFRLLGRKITV